MRAHHLASDWAASLYDHLEVAEVDTHLVFVKRHWIVPLKKLPERNPAILFNRLNKPMLVYTVELKEKDAMFLCIKGSENPSMYYKIFFKVVQ